VLTTYTKQIELPKVPKYKQQVRARRSLTVKQARVFIEKTKGQPYGLFFELLIRTGLRPGEARALQWRDLDLTAGTLTVERAVSRVGTEFVVGEPKNDASYRTVPIAALEGLLPRLREHQISLKDHGPGDWVFPSSRGTVMSDRNLQRRYLVPILKAAGLPLDFTMYELRHTCASLLHAAGIPGKIVAARLGNDETITLSVYTHILPGQQEEASKAFDALLSAADEGSRRSAGTQVAPNL
jgi:integrase